MRTIHSDDCLRCIFVNSGSNCGYTYIDCRLENGKSCVDESLLGPGSCYTPDRVDPPGWCPLPVQVVRKEE